MDIGGRGGGIGGEVGGREEEDAELRGGAIGAGLGKLVVLLHHILEVLGGGDGDQVVKVLAGELVADQGGPAVDFGHLAHDLREGGVPMDGDDAGVAADVTEGAVAGAGEDLAAIAAEELDLLGGGGGGMVVGGAAIGVIAGGGPEVFGFGGHEGRKLGFWGGELEKP